MGACHLFEQVGLAHVVAGNLGGATEGSGGRGRVVERKIGGGDARLNAFAHPGIGVEEAPVGGDRLAVAALAEQGLAAQELLFLGKLVRVGPLAAERRIQVVERGKSLAVKLFAEIGAGQVVLGLALENGVDVGGVEQLGIERAGVGIVAIAVQEHTLGQDALGRLVFQQRRGCGRQAHRRRGGAGHGFRICCCVNRRGCGSGWR